MNFNFSANPHLYFGPGQSARLPELISNFGRNVLIITGARSFVRSAQWESLTNELKKNRILFHQAVIDGEPTPAMVDGITQKFRNDRIDVVAAIGGGSVLDGGKAVSAMLPMKKPVIDYLEGVGTLPYDGNKLPFIAVPTTAGTGSEATKNAVISQTGKNGFKKSLRHERLIPDIAVVDPELTLSCPASVTSACGMDALTQLIESLVSTQASAITDSLASGALTVLGESIIPAATTSPDDIDLRSRISYASYVSGLTLANAGLGLVHGLAGTLGGFFDIPHGVACGTLLAETTRQNVDALIRTDPDGIALRKYASAASLLDPSGTGGSAKHDVRRLVSLLEHWSDALDMPRLGEYGITGEDVERITAAAGQKNNPAVLPAEKVRRIIENRL